MTLQRREESMWMILLSTKPTILFDFLEICGMFLERILDVFGYDFESSPLRIFWSLSQTNLEGIIFMVQYNSKKALLKVLSLLYAIFKKIHFLCNKIISWKKNFLVANYLKWRLDTSEEITLPSLSPAPTLPEINNNW